MFVNPFELPKTPVFPNKTVSISDFGAKEHTISTPAFNNAISCVSKSGDGKVVVPAGNWLSEAIHLKGNKD